MWSPRGDLIAFTKLGNGSFAIGIMKPDGSGERILTEGYHNEGPTFAPNGRVVMFFRDPGGNGGPVALYGRHHRPERAAGADAGLCLGPGLVAAPDLDLRNSETAGNSRVPLAIRSTRSRPINHDITFGGPVHFSRSRQRLVKVDGTFA